MRALRPSPSSATVVIAAPPNDVPADTAPVRSSGRTVRLKKSTVGGLSTKLIVLFLAAHVPLALLIGRFPTLATVHALVALAFGVWWACHGDRLGHVILATGYIAGGEVLWRMTGAQVNWEFGKYAVAGVLILALLRNRAHFPPAIPLGYFALLLPSVTLTMNNHDWAEARNQISFNLSGPFALMICAWFFTRVRVSADQMRALFVAIIGPIIGVATIAAVSTFSGAEIFFSENSNFVTSGGFGPNQVSGALGLGAMLALFLMVDDRTDRFGSVVLGAAMLGLAIQSALTFSRGGLYMAAGGVAIAGCFAATDVRLRGRLIGLLVVLFVAANYAVIPYVDAFTGGQIGTRFSDTYLTGRDRMIRADIELWKQNPVFGVGPGEARAFRAGFGTSEDGLPTTSRSSLAHTEFSRMLSEHGLFGVGALMLLLLGAVLNIRKQTSIRGRALVAGLTTWSTLFMLSYATRLLAPSFAFGLGFACLVFDPAAEPLATKSRITFGFLRRRTLRTLVDGHPAAVAAIDARH